MRIFLSSHNTESFQNQTQRTLFVLIHKMIDKLDQCNIVNKDFADLNILTGNKEDSEQRKEMFYRLQLNEFNFISKKYTDFLIDLMIF